MSSVGGRPGDPGPLPSKSDPVVGLTKDEQSSINNNSSVDDITTARTSSAKINQHNKDEGNS